MATYAIMGALAGAFGSMIPGPAWVGAVVGGVLITWFAASLAGFDCAVIVTAHENIDFQVLVDNLPRVVDTRDALNGNPSDNIVRL